jgi:hypothetical protein
MIAPNALGVKPPDLGPSQRRHAMARGAAPWLRPVLAGTLAAPNRKLAPVALRRGGAGLSMEQDQAPQFRQHPI